MNWLLNQCFGRQLRKKTDRYLQDLSRLPRETSQRKAKDALARMRNEPGPKVTLGETMWGEEVVVPLHFLINSCGLCTGGMDAGKSMFVALILRAVLSQALRYGDMGVGIVDPKRDLFFIGLYLIQELLHDLEREDPQAAKKARRRLVILDFSLKDPVTSYNILARWPYIDPYFLAESRVEQLLDQLPSGSDKINLIAIPVLRNLILLLSEFSLPITQFSKIIHDDNFRSQLLARSANRTLCDYFARQFVSVPKPTIGAVERRLEALFGSENMQLAVAGKTAPDFRHHQEKGDLVFANFFSNSMSFSSQVAIAELIFSDISHSVFARREMERPFLWICDEAQNLFRTETLRQNMTRLLTMSRSFGSYFLLITQNLTVGIRDPQMLEILNTNTRWGFVLRGEPGDCAFLKPALPVTGRKLRPQLDPFQPRAFYTISEERSLGLDSVASLPDRVGYLWLKTRSDEAIKIRTLQLDIPHGRDLEAATLPIRRDPTIGQRFSRKEYEHLVEERDRKWMTEEKEGEYGEFLKKAYQRAHGGNRGE